MTRPEDPQPETQGAGAGKPPIPPADLADAGEPPRRGRRLPREFIQALRRRRSES